MTRFMLAALTDAFPDGLYRWPGGWISAHDLETKPVHAGQPHRTVTINALIDRGQLEDREAGVVQLTLLGRKVLLDEHERINP